jgi:anti-sigma factor RsiW
MRMDCHEARLLLLDRRRDRLDPDPRAAVDAHLDECAACRHEDAADRALSLALEQRLPRRTAPASLRRSLDARWRPEARGSGARSIAARTFAAGVAFASIAAVVFFVMRPVPPDPAMLNEAVNDHLRVLYSLHPVEVESSDMHRVKPWFEGRLDFAPTSFAGDDDFPLQGALVSYFIDRKAAAFVYRARLHVITLFVVRADGLPWPPGAEGPGSSRGLGPLRTLRGFHALFWRHADLGYALVSDVNEGDLRALAQRIVAASGG